MAKYFFQDGGDTFDSNPLFNKLIDNLYQQTSQPSQNNEELIDEESDFIRNLREYDKEQPSDYEKQLEDRINQLSKQLDDQLQSITNTHDELSGYSDDDSLDFLMQNYDTQSANTQYTPYTAESINYKVQEKKAIAKSKNNYGNIRSPKTGEFMNYSTPEEGKNALLHQLNLYKTGKTRNPVNGESTLYSAMSVYAPAADRNNPKVYAEFIAKKLGISPNEKIKNIDVEKWANAISLMEGNKNID